MPMRYALLVGVDHYFNDGTRKNEEGAQASLPNLSGCVHDVHSIKEVLETEYSFKDISVLLSPSHQPTSRNTQHFDPNYLPTFDNIKREFESIRKKANAGDFFYFHFSGHGARINRVVQSPLGREKDPSLMTADYCCGKPAVRGWQLNNWLRKLNQKEVKVVVSLDSCYSGGAWRGDRATYRTPENWPSIPNLPIDELVASQEERDDTMALSSRTAKAEISWSINPDAFTLMTACSAHEKAAERIYNGKARGAFTYELLAYLEDNKYCVTYRMIQSYLQVQLKPQTPAVYGRDSFLFLKDTNLFSICPLNVTLEGNRVIIPVGRAHGVHIGSEFTPFPLTSNLSLAVEQIEELRSSFPVSPQIKDILDQYRNIVVASRWSLGKSCILRVIANRAIGTEFRDSLRGILESHIVNAVEVTEAEQNDSSEYEETAVDELTVFKLQSGDDGILKIVGPESLVGCSDPIWARKLGPNRNSWSIGELAAEVAAPLIHLARFRQTLYLSPKKTQEGEKQKGLFEVSLLPNGEMPEAEVYPAKQMFKYTFRNNSNDYLHFALLNLTSDFEIHQLFPATDSRQIVAPGRSKSFKFSVYIPSAPPEFHDVIQSRPSFQDIFRTLVSKDGGVSWKTLELPSIWESDRMSIMETATARKRNMVQQGEEEEGWWVCDKVIITSTEV